MELFVHLFENGRRHGTLMPPQRVIATLSWEARAGARNGHRTRRWPFLLLALITLRVVHSFEGLRTPERYADQDGPERPSQTNSTTGDD